MSLDEIGFLMFLCAVHGGRGACNVGPKFTPYIARKNEHNIN